MTDMKEIYEIVNGVSEILSVQNINDESYIEKVKELNIKAFNLVHKYTRENRNSDRIIIGYLMIALFDTLRLPKDVIDEINNDLSELATNSDFDFSTILQ